MKLENQLKMIVLRHGLILLSHMKRIASICFCFRCQIKIIKKKSKNFGMYRYLFFRTFIYSLLESNSFCLVYLKITLIDMHILIFDVF